MKFEWDEQKRLINLQKHGIDFSDVWQLFDNWRHTIEYDRFEYDEIRYFTLGLLDGRIIAVSHTETEKLIRIISARKANKNEQTEYFKEITN
jgi:uncharacterized DUF497 family protein